MSDGLLSILIHVGETAEKLPRLLQTIWNQRGSRQTPPIHISVTNEALIPEIERWNAIYGEECIQTHLFAAKTPPGIIKNSVLTEVKSKYITFLTQDNRLTPEYLTTSMELLELHDAPDIIHTDYLCITTGEETQGDSGYISTASFTKDSLRSKNILGPGVLVRKAVWESSPFREKTMYDQWDFWVQAALQGFSFHHIQECLVSKEHTRPSFRTRAEDGREKALLVINNHVFFHMHTFRWAMAYLRGQAWATAWAFMQVPGALDVSKMMNDYCAQKSGMNRLNEKILEDFERLDLMEEK